MPLKLSLDSWSKLFFALAGVLILPQIVILYLAIPNLPPAVPLFYSLPWGADRLTTPVWLWTLPLASTGLVTTNLIASQLFRERVLARILGSSSFLVALLTLISLVKIILLGLP